MPSRNMNEGNLVHQVRYTALSSVEINPIGKAVRDSIEDGVIFLDPSTACPDCFDSGHLPSRGSLCHAAYAAAIQIGDARSGLTICAGNTFQPIYPLGPDPAGC